MNAFCSKCIELQPRVITMLFGVMNIKAQRLKRFIDAGYTITKQHHAFWYRIMGDLVTIIQFEKVVGDPPPVQVTYDLEVHKPERTAASGDA